MNLGYTWAWREKKHALPPPREMSETSEGGFEHDHAMCSIGVFHYAANRDPVFVGIPYSTRRPPGDLCVTWNTQLATCVLVDLIITCILLDCSSTISMGRTEEGYKTERLIIEVEKNTCLYDKQSPLYKDLNKKEDIWNDIAQRVGFTGEWPQMSQSI